MYKQTHFATPESLTMFLNERNIRDNQIVKIQYCPDANYDFQWILIYLYNPYQ